MLWFERLFPPLMLLWPLAILLCVRPVPDRATDEAPALTRRTVLATLAAQLLMVLLQVASEAGLEGTLMLWHGWRPVVSVTRAASGPKGMISAPARTAIDAARDPRAFIRANATAAVTTSAMAATAAGVT